MKKLVAVAIILTLLTWAAIATTQDNAASQGVPMLAPTLPASLGNFYPPKTPAPVYYLEMHALSRPFSGMLADMFQDDMTNARANYDAFKTQYVKVAALVPEWTSLFPIEPVDKLGAIIATGKPDEVMAAAGEVGQACGRCHHAYMPAVQHAYHWGDFDAITATDPLSKATVPFKDLMMMMEGSMTGAIVDLQQGQIENARAQLDGFSARFTEMAQTCVACHETERKYYVDKEITGTIDNLKQLLAQEKVDPQAVGGLFKRIGQESCAKCHLVHIPAAYANARTPGM